MMQPLEEAPVNEAATLLRRLFPERATELARENKRFSSYFEKGIVLGPEDVVDEEAQQRASFMIAALDRAGLYCSNAAPQAVTRI